MWLFLGLAALVTATVYLARQRIHQRWEGTRMDSVAGRDAQYRWDNSLIGFLIHRGDPVLLIGERGVSDLDLLVKPSRWWDRLFRALGLSLACRTQDPVLADQAYIATDQVSCCAALRSSERARQGLRRLLDLESDYAIIVRGIHFRDRRMWVEVRAKESFAEEGVDALGREIIERLRQVAASLSEALPRKNERRCDRFAMWATVLVGLSSALLVTGLIQAVRIELWQIYPGILDKERIAVYGAVAALVVIVSLTASAIALLGRTARTHIVLVELWSAGLIGAFLNGYVMVHEFNHEFDRTPTHRYRVAVHGKDTSSFRGGSDHYLIVENWTVPGDTLRQEVHSGDYEKVRRADMVDVFVRTGSLGARYIEDMRPVE